ncbi:LAFE_0B05952g1_1 [Lachancea fermentati]|uniref:LAFE_0B05952g1_1 n=1 Tax=Lachancea fermentati TaxID=4955 RepID=A0A1G4M7X1_LACFM|nr:LAFE_0B05952g1_1 [Lachancea fermentati]
MFSNLISLAHFCDKHGPRVLLVTQCAENSEELLLPSYPTDSYCESCLINFGGFKDEGLCSMRTKLQSKHYVSTQYSSIRYQLLYSIVRYMFSEETMSYDGSPLVFYDNSKGLNLVIGFKLQDANARGNERRYGLILTLDSHDHLKDMALLSHHWEFIINGFNKMVGYIKKLRDDEIERKNRNETCGEFTPIVGAYLRGNKLKEPRNLANLTNDELIFVRLHKWNTFMLDVLGK